MFRKLARDLKFEPRIGPALPPGVSDVNSIVFLYHPIQLAAFLEAAWAERFQTDARRSPVPEMPGGQGGTRPGFEGNFLETLLALLCIPMPNRGSDGDCRNAVVFDHLIYAYMIENTRIYEIFRKVIYEYLHGERLETPSEETQRWLRTTEELFYRDTPPFFAFQLTSYIRPDIRATRRNAYYRMFGMDLNHGTDDGRPYSYERAVAANRDFVPTFEAFLREVWRGIINARNTTGPNTTDDAAIANLAGRLSEMLKDRRENGNLSREEFFFVATMSWFHLTVEFDSPIVLDLKAQGSSPAERLRAIGERVGIPPHGRAYDMFSLADPMSRLLIAIESGSLSEAANVPLLYRERDTPVVVPRTPLRDDITTIITNWSSATGRNIKADPVTASPNSAISPATVPPAISAPTMSPNGGSPVTVPRT
jgi:hypothetical protein